MNESDYRQASGQPPSADAWQRWFDSPPGRYLLAWEQAQCDLLVDEVFGFYSVQCGLPQLDSLRASRIATRIGAVTAGDRGCLPAAPAAIVPDLPGDGRALVQVGHFGELPFDSQSIDLLVLPHVLERAADPHAVLREADRVLRPEGHLILTGFNPVSLWGARQLLPGWMAPPFLPSGGQSIVAPRLRDWLKLLSFEPAPARYGCFRPACQTEAWLARSAFLERAGDRWWPVCGAAYTLSAVKRVRGMRLVGAVRRLAPVAAPVGAARVREGASGRSGAARASGRGSIRP
ncbi:MAG: methyltransferase domain-containing protein [Betaproteobacteria bacterium]|nr:methyltransferase domain-containing protein [Betaproteobacteria bacterium]